MQESGAAAPAVGTELSVPVDSIAYRGEGIARHGGWVFFIPGVIAGEQVRVRVRRVRRRFVEADVVHIESPSPERLSPEVILEGADPAVMPGCCYAHMTYAEELRVKQAQLSDFLVRTGLCAPGDLDSMVPSPRFLHYRNKIVLHARHDAQGIRLGYVGADNHTVRDLPFCPLAEDAINQRLEALRREAGFTARAAAHHRLTLRFTPADGVLEWWDGADPSAPPLTEATRLGDLAVPRGSFFQVNPGIGDALMDRVARELETIRPEAVLDLFCGVGLFALTAASLGIETVIGADRDAAAIAAGRENARKRGFALRLLATDAGSAARTQLPRLPSDRTCVILDPPRTGLEAGLREALLRLRPQCLLYVSCAPDTLSRDLRSLAASGYRLRRAVPLDMFPRTAHFEILACIERPKG